MTVSKDLIAGIKPELATWMWESRDSFYKTYTPIYPKLVNVHAVSNEGDYKTAGGFWKGTSGIGMSELFDVVDYGSYQQDAPVDGFTVYALVKQKAATVKIPREVSRNFWRTRDFLKDYIKAHGAKAIANTREKIVAKLYNVGGYTSGDDFLNNDNSDLGLTTYASPKLGYDGKPFFTRLANERIAKYGGTFYNACVENRVPDFDMALTMWNLLTATNNKLENGQPFDNSQDVIITCAPGRGMYWDMVCNSQLRPNGSNNDKNPLVGRIKDIIENPHFTTSTFDCMQKRANMFDVWFSEPDIQFFADHTPERYGCDIVMDYAVTMRNFRAGVSNNAPIS